MWLPGIKVVTYRVQSEKPIPGCHRQRFVVHFNHLKPSQTRTQETQQEGKPNEVNRGQANVSDNEQDRMTLTWHPTAQEGEVQPREPTECGGPTWGRREQPTLQITMHLAFICTLSHKVMSSKWGSHVPKQVGDTQSLIPIDNASCQKYLPEPSMNYELSMFCCTTTVTLSCHQFFFLL